MPALHFFITFSETSLLPASVLHQPSSDRVRSSPPDPPPPSLTRHYSAGRGAAPQRTRACARCRRAFHTLLPASVLQQTSSDRVRSSPPDPPPPSLTRHYSAGRGAAPQRTRACARCRRAF